MTWRTARFIVLIAAIYFGSFHRDGIFTHSGKAGKEAVLPKRYAGCEGAGLYTNTTCRQTCMAQANATAWLPLSGDVLQPTLSCHWCKDWAGGDTIFDHITALHEGKVLGSVLDAGTGTSSLTWIAKDLKPKKWTAVTASATAKEELESSKLIKKHTRPGDELLLGNWLNASFLEGEVYDVILADYLLGAIDGHAPYYQEELFTRLKRQLAPGGRMYIVGKDPTPYPGRYQYTGPAVYHPQHAVHQVEDIDHLLKGCLSHASRRPYREFPLAWVVARAKEAGLQVASQQAFPIVHGTKALHAQLDVCASAIKEIEGRHLYNGLKERVQQLRDRIDENPMIKDNGVCYGVDYVVALQA